MVNMEVLLKMKCPGELNLSFMTQAEKFTKAVCFITRVITFGDQLLKEMII